MKNKNFGIFLGITTSILFGTLGFVSKKIYNYGINPDNALLFGTIIGLVFSFITSTLINKNLSFLKTTKNDIIYFVINGALIGYLLLELTILKSLLFIPAGMQSIITNSSPLFVIILSSILLNYKQSKKDILSSILIIIGLILTVGKIESTKSNITIGILLAFISCLFKAINSILIEKKGAVNIYSYWFYSFLFSSFFLIIMGIFNGSMLSINFNINSIIFIIILGVFNLSLPYITMVNTYKYLGSIYGSIIMASCPVISVLVDCFILKEIFTVYQFFGMLFIIFATIVSAKNENKLEK